MKTKHIKCKDGSNRIHVLTTCSYTNCKKEFWLIKSDYDKGGNKYCSRECSSLAHRTRVEVKCANCGKVFSRTPSKLKNSKHGFHFCSQQCKNISQRLDGITEMHPSHYGSCRVNYRLTAYNVYKPKCAVCGYDKVEGILEVHHIDKDRNHNDIDNLIVLCPNCHTMVTRNLYTLVSTGTGKDRIGKLVCNVTGK